MATAIEHTIPCENCNTQISLHDWPWHSSQCTTPSKKRRIEDIEDNNTEESSGDNIPCEYCNAQISLNDWKSHSEQCADAHKTRVENLKSDINNDESMTEQIPCEYCDKPINIHDLEWHSRQCVNNNNKQDASNIKSSNTNQSMDVLIPCEYCGAQISINDWMLHMQQCANTEQQRIENLFKVSKEEQPNLIPCEYCDKLFALQFIEDHQTECRRKQNALEFQTGGTFEHAFGGVFPFPKTWNQSSPYNLSRYTLEPDTEEYKFVEENFHKTLPTSQIVQIERIQNRRWYRQYDAHKDDFIERYGNSTEQWLFHGCKSESTEAIINDCFNRSHAHRCAAGQGIYFATGASTSHSYTQPDANQHRHMFMARVLVGKTTAGNATTRICPPGFDTTGGGAVFVTYHDAQAYGEYLITFR